MKLRLWICLLSLYGAEVLALPLDHPLTGRLFYTPAQRSMLANARTHQITDVPKIHATREPLSEPAPISFDGVITRSDGVSATHWINGLPHAGQPANNVRSLKPGQTRAHQKVYEPYQLLRTAPSSSVPRTSPATENEATP